MRNKRRKAALALKTKSSKQRDKALERVGAKLFGEYWIAGRKADDELGASMRPIAAAIENVILGHKIELRATIAPLPNDPKLAARTARARNREMNYAWQSRAVIHWLQHDHDIDVTVKGFDSAKFEKFFSEHFSSSDETAIRKAAVSERMTGGAHPGTAGLRWKTFHTDICEETGVKCDERTIRNDVDEWRLRSVK